MTRKQIIQVALLVVLASTLSSVVAYRMAVRRLQPHLTPTAAAATPGGASVAVQGCVDIHDAAAHIGQEGCVAGRVLRVVASRGGNTFLDFCEDYRNCPFSAVIFSSDRPKFGNLDTLRGRQVEIRGSIKMYNGRSEIIIHDPEQVRSAN